MPRCDGVIFDHTTFTILPLYIFIVTVSNVMPVVSIELSKGNGMKKTQEIDGEIDNHVTRMVNDNVFLKLRTEVVTTNLYHASPLTRVYKISYKSLQKAHYHDSSFLKWKNRKLLYFHKHLNGSDFGESAEHKFRNGHSKIFKKRFASLKSNVKEKGKIEDIVRQSILVDPVQSETLNFTQNSEEFMKKLNFTAYERFLHELSLSRRVTLDAERAFLCIVFITLTIMAAVWAAGMCRVRRHSPWDVPDFESSQPLTTVKDAILRKSKYLPMFADYYRYQEKRRKNPFIDC